MSAERSNFLFGICHDDKYLSVKYLTERNTFFFLVCSVIISHPSLQFYFLLCDMATIKGANLFVECLRKYGVREIFGVPGEANPDFMLVCLPLPLSYTKKREKTKKRKEKVDRNGLQYGIHI
jgi:hypothetical protein